MNLEITAFNLLFGLLFCLVNFVMVIGCYWLFGKVGMFTWICIATIIANIQVTKTIDLFGQAATLGNVFYGSIFLATDIMNERYGRKEASRSVLLGFFSNLVLIIGMQMALVFTPLNGVDIAQGALETIFGLVPRICLGSLVAYLVSQFMDIILFNKIKEKTKGKLVWLRNNAATMISQFFDTAIFVLISFAGVYSWDIVLAIFVSTYVLKFIVALIDTPFLYLSKRIKPGILLGESSNKAVARLIEIKDKIFKKHNKDTEDKS